MIGRSKKSSATLPERLDALRAATELSDGRLPDDAVVFARNVIDKADQRLRHGTTHTLVALLGATGAGKSSLANALIGSDVAATGVRRPTTSSTLACLWGKPDELGEAGPLLDWLEIEQRHLVGHDSVGNNEQLNGLILLDVPDHDSVQVSNRLEMERIAEHCDLMIWVTDPEKYADAALHHYLSTVAGHDAVMILVLNKADQLDDHSLEACRADLARLATNDGIAAPIVIALSATTGAGVEALVTRISEAIRANEAMAARLSADIAAASTELVAANGQVDAVKINDRSVRSLADDLVGATGIDTVTDAVAAGTKRDAAAVMGWPYTRWMRKLRPHPLRRLHLGAGSGGRSSLPEASAAQSLRSEGAIRSFIDDVSTDLPDPWPQVLRDAGTPDSRILADRLDRAVGDGVRAHASRSPRWWSLVGVLQIALATAAAVGGIWLTVLFALAWLQVPDPPTPEWQGWPVPTLLFGAGVILGLVVAMIARRVAGLSARRAARRARAAAIDNVEGVANQLVVEPIRAELASRAELVALLHRAGG